MLTSFASGTLALFTATVLALSVYCLVVSVHLPREHRSEAFQRGVGAYVLWGSIAVSCMAAALALRVALVDLPPYAAVIAGGAAMLVAPLVLKLLPDSLLDGLAGPALFAASATVLAAATQWG